jgi:hypothetical protein
MERRGWREEDRERIMEGGRERERERKREKEKERVRKK